MKTNLLPQVEEKIITLRDQQVILDCDVAELYGVETKRINEAVNNNPEKFPDGYILEVDNQEFSILRSKFSTTKFSKTRQLPKGLHRERALHAGHHLEESASCTDHYRHRGGIRQVERAVAGNRGNPQTTGE